MLLRSFVRCCGFLLAAVVIVPLVFVICRNYIRYFSRRYSFHSFPVTCVEQKSDFIVNYYVLVGALLLCVTGLGVIVVVESIKV